MGPPTASTTTASQPVSLPDARSFVPTARQFWLLLAGYFVLHVITRSLITEGAGIDEADQLVRGQHLSLGYGPQAPLYTWLMTLFLRAFGSSVFSLALLRELMLFGIYALTYLNARNLTRSHICGVVAALALQFYPTFVWESQRELTHSILASSMVLLMLLIFQRLQKDKLWIHLAFGFSAGLAILSKYNAGLVYAALILSALSLPSLRHRILNWRLFPALGTTALIVLPSALWMLRHRAEASSSMYKFGIHGAMPWLQAVKTGLWVWVETAGLHILPLLVLFGLLFCGPLFFKLKATPPRPSPPPPSRSASQVPEITLLWRVFLILNAFVVIAILCLKVTAFKDRWMQPLFVWLPILLILVAKPFLAGWRSRTFLLAGAFVTVAMAFVIPGRLLFTEARGRRDVLNAPFRALAKDLSRPVESVDTIISNDYWLAGNLVLWFPSKAVYSLDLNRPPEHVANALLIWDASRHAELPPALARFATNSIERNALPVPAYVEEKWKFHKSKAMKLGFVEVGRSPR
jgi:lipopolysaccharide core galacturonosyltransferase RgtB